MSDDDAHLIPLSEPCVEGNARAYLEECLETNFVSSVGPFVSRFEGEFAAALETPHAVACASGTAALHLALKVADVGPGDEVWASDFSFIATVNPVTYVGAAPLLVDADDETWNMDPELVTAELRRRAASGLPLPKAVVAAHVLGLPANLEPIAEICRQLGVVLIEDAAEALGAGYSEEAGKLAGRKVGTIGDVGCFSFNGNKIITTGGGGMVVTANAEWARRTRHLSTQARLPGPEYFHDEIGFNYRLTNLAAALGVAQLEVLPEYVARKLAIAAHYDEAFRGIPGLILPPRPSWAAPTMWLYSILLDRAKAGLGRRELREHLASKNISTRPVWAPAHLMPFYKTAPRLGGAVGERLFDQGLSLPCSVSLTPEEQQRVIDAVRERFG